MRFELVSKADSIIRKVKPIGTKRATHAVERGRMGEASGERAKAAEGEEEDEGEEEGG